ncbi:MAG: hypothetical protein FJZ00_11520 [Candidatus Sericytochromatia bacterium]|uniref:Uncharacterized protein n=1 Tax=Candidatus Tanganyikabacteria bacterium TaxID=2961651 RepID=A0A937X7X0_9BACT|nr:hypothetical protein [Candidatus Tanganyikabacteria bacterium]
MSTVNRNGGLGGLWPRPVRKDGAGTGSDAKAAAPRAAADKANFSNATSRLTDLAGELLAAPSGKASDLVRDSKDLGDLIEKALERNLGRPVKLGKHRDALVSHVAAGLNPGLSFDDVKGRIG